MGNAELEGRDRGLDFVSRVLWTFYYISVLQAVNATFRVVRREEVSILFQLCASRRFLRSLGRIRKDSMSSHKLSGDGVNHCFSWDLLCGSPVIWYVYGADSSIPSVFNKVGMGTLGSFAFPNKPLGYR